MAQNRTLACVDPGEYTATVTWTERIGGQQIPRCAEMAPLKITGTTGILYLDDDGEDTLEFRLATNKSVQVYIGMTVDGMVRERVINSVRNSTRCCYGRTIGTGSVCSTHTEEWLAAEVRREAQQVRDKQIPVPDREAIEREAEVAREARRVSAAAGNAEWCRAADCARWYVRVEDRKPGEIVTVRSRGGRTSQVQLVREIADGVWEHAAATNVTA